MHLTPAQLYVEHIGFEPAKELQRLPGGSRDGGGNNGKKKKKKENKLPPEHEQLLTAAWDATADNVAECTDALRQFYWTHFSKPALAWGRTLASAVAMTP